MIPLSSSFVDSLRAVRADDGERIWGIFRLYEVNAPLELDATL